jgi:phosphotransferase family enzyme
MMQSEQPLPGGCVNEVARLEDTVHRTSGPWTPAVHALLRHLEAKGFDAAPRALGFDDQGREVLTYIEGAVLGEPWPPELLTDEGLGQLASLLQRYHEAVEDFIPPPGSTWRHSEAALQQGDVICHGDPGPWNFVWREGSAVGLIDWDFAEPGPALSDVAYLAWNSVPLRGDLRPAMVGFTRTPDFRRRIEVISRAYGRFTPAEIVVGVLRRGRIEVARIREFGQQGVYPWRRFLSSGDADVFEAEMVWVREHRDEWV